MIEVTVEITAGQTRSRTTVRAESILRALEIARGSNPGCEVGLTFPIDPEGFFVDPSAPQERRIAAA